MLRMTVLDEEATFALLQISWKHTHSSLVEAFLEKADIISPDNVLVIREVSVGEERLHAGAAGLYMSQDERERAVLSVFPYFQTAMGSAQHLLF